MLRRHAADVRRFGNNGLPPCASGAARNQEGEKVIRLRSRMATIVMGVALVVASVAFRAGAGQEDDLPAMVAQAKTAANYEAIAKKYDVMAAEEKSRAAMHTKMGENLKSMGGAAIGKYHMDQHCASITRDASSLATNYEQMAAAYRAMAATAPVK